MVVVDEVGVLADDEAEADSFSSSSTSFAWSAARVDSADETASLSAVVWRVPSVCPAVTCWPGVTVTVATCPADLERGSGVADRIDVADDGHGGADVRPGDRGLR